MCRRPLHQTEVAKTLGLNFKLKTQTFVLHPRDCPLAFESSASLIQKMVDKS